MTSEEKESILNEVAISIDEYANIISALELTIKSLNIQPVASPLINFRDALNHLVLAYRNISDDIKLMQQKSSIEEHLSRGTKDTLIFITITIRKRLEEIFSTYPVKNKNYREKNKLRKIIHRAKNLIFDIRFSSAILIERDVTTHINTIDQIISETKVLLTSWDLEYLLIKRSESEKIK